MAMRTGKAAAILAAAVLGVAASQASAASYTWTPTAAGTTYDWNAGVSNWGGGFPNNIDDVANLNIDILGNQTVRLQTNIAVGTLNLGDPTISPTYTNAYTISSGTGTNTLTFQATGGAATALNVQSGGLASPNYTANAISANVALGGGSPLTVTQSGQMPFTLANVNVNSTTLTIAGTGVGTMGIGGILSGTGGLTPSHLVKTSTANLSLDSTLNTFAGDITVNRGSLVMVGGNIRTASAITINGALSTAAASLGGVVTLGSGSSLTTNPGQRLPLNGTVTLNGGTLSPGGQPLSGAAAGQLVEDDLSSLALNSGYSLLNLSAGTGSGGTLLKPTTLSRENGASALIRSNTLGGTAKVIATNFETDPRDNTGYLKGANGAAASTTMSIIPWMVGSNTNAYAGSSSAFATYVNGIGFRATDTTTEYSTSITAGAGNNVRTGTITLAADAIVNSFVYTTGSANNFAAAASRKLTITSGGLIFSANNGALGVAGSSFAGTIDFGAAEGVVWANAANTNGINAVVAGSGGLTKAGSGILILTGANSYTGETIVGAGTLQIGNGTQVSNLGTGATGNVEIAAGGVLSLMNGSAINDGASVTLDSYGLLNGKMILGTGVNETVAGLSFGSLSQVGGSWGATGSGATNINDTYFSGSGILNVVPVPEPASLALMAIGGLALMRRRRAR